MLIIIYNSTKDAAFLKLEANLKNYSIALRTEIEELIDEDSLVSIRTLNSIHSHGLVGERFQLFDKNGKVIIADSILSETPHSKLEKILNDSLEYEKQKINRHEYYILWSKFESENDSVFVLETVASLKEVYEELDRLFYLLLILIPVGLILTGFAAYLISKAAFKPITRMTEYCKKYFR